MLNSLLSFIALRPAGPKTQITIIAVKSQITPPSCDGLGITLSNLALKLSLYEPHIGHISYWTGYFAAITIVNCVVPTMFIHGNIYSFKLPGGDCQGDSVMAH